MTDHPLITRLAAANPARLDPARAAAAATRDPVEERLLAAIARDPRTPSVTRRTEAPAWRRAHPVALVVASLAVCASAAAAIVSLTGHASQPLAGRVPGAHVARPGPFGAESVSGERYRVTVTPDIQAGDAGWCTDILYGPAGRYALGSGGGCETGGSYPTTGRPLFGLSLIHI